MFSRDLRVALATAVLAIGVPVGARVYVGARTQDVADRLSVAAAVPARIGGIDADLTGSLRLSDVALGDLASVEGLEASVSMGSLLAGELRADEIRVTRPHIDLAMSRGGGGDAQELAALARRLARRPSAGSGRGGSGRLRRIVVAEGSLTVRIAGVGELTADSVELVPDRGGVRVIAGRLHLTGTSHGVVGELTFARGAADLAMPGMTFGRALAVGGMGTIELRGGTYTLTELAAGRLGPAGPLEVRGSVDDDGVPRAVTAEIASHQLRVTGDRVPLGPLAGLLPGGIDVAHAHGTGTVALTRDRVQVDGSLAGALVTHPTVAATPIPADGSMKADLAIGADAIVLSHAQLTTGALSLTAAGWVRRTGTAAAQLDVTLAEAACADQLAAIPAAARGPLDALLLEGTFGAQARLAIDLSAPESEGVRITGSLRGTCKALAEAPAGDVTRLAKAGDQQLADGSVRRLDPADPSYQSLDRLPAYVRGAFVSAEDGRYWQHHGFDLEQISRSFEIDLREERLARGGSTISQQLVKNAFLSQRRTLDRKLQEAVLTWRLEARLDKWQILERYLNIIELGPRVFGLRAAALHWFERAPRDLTIRQAAFLAALTSQPTSMSRRVRKHGGLDPSSAERVAVVLRAMKRDGVISAEAYSEARGDGMMFSKAALDTDP